MFSNCSRELSKEETAETANDTSPTKQHDSCLEDKVVKVLGRSSSRSHFTENSGQMNEKEQSESNCSLHEESKRKKRSYGKSILDEIIWKNRDHCSFFSITEKLFLYIFVNIFRFRGANKSVCLSVVATVTRGVEQWIRDRCILRRALRFQIDLSRIRFRDHPGELGKRPILRPVWIFFFFCRRQIELLNSHV